MPEVVDNTEQVKIAKVFGVVFSDNLNFDEHVSYVLSMCSQRLYLIILLRSQLMPERKLPEICVALIVSRISYALSAWGDFLTGQQTKGLMFYFVKYDVFWSLFLHMCM